MLLNNNLDKELKIQYPTVSARKFYTEKCGFKEILIPNTDSLLLVMNKSEIKKFINNVEKRTGAKIKLA